MLPGIFDVRSRRVDGRPGRTWALSRSAPPAGSLPRHPDVWGDRQSSAFGKQKGAPGVRQSAQVRPGRPSTRRERASKAPGSIEGNEKKKRRRRKERREREEREEGRGEGEREGKEEESKNPGIEEFLVDFPLQAVGRG